MNEFKFNEKYLSQIPALQLLINLGYLYLSPSEALTQRQGKAGNVLLELAFRFKLFFVDRKTMEIAVHPDKTVIVKAPIGANYTTVEQKVRRRAGWIKRQLDFFRQFDPRTPRRNKVFDLV